MTTVRRGAAALAAAAVLGTGFAPAALAAPSPSPSPSADLPAGLYGTGDPTYDGVWRQSLALLAQDTAGVTPADQAVAFLTGQQCADGAFAAYRPDPSAACDAKTKPDTNSSGAAAQALAALGGQDAAVAKTVGWLKSVQNDDGGWGFYPGDASDANSTSAVIGALAAAGEKPAEVTSKGGRSPYDSLLTFALPCSGDDGGAFEYQKGTPGFIADSTAAAVTAANGRGLVVPPATGTGGQDAECGSGADLADAARNGAAYLAGEMAGTGHLDTPPMPGAEDSDPAPDYGNTADAVVALSAQGVPQQAAKPLDWLKKNGASWAEQAGPAAWAQLVLAAHATGTDPRDFGGTDLVAGLNATGPAPKSGDASAQPEANGSEAAGEEAGDDDGGSLTTWWIVGVFFIAAVGVGFLFSGRRKNQG
ncbi:prenyltransferase/squalene oxidase repeat-containing protein [Streptomyces sp. C10-9-1]|uniref:prenyltransferase/squalene oxidase repeat-containing protein n=1 Tax=Streptomyces sp. C10-9-1 TaxID=1859285 RepID=UPI003D7402DA